MNLPNVEHALVEREKITDDLIDGELTTPDGQRPRIRTVWQLDHGQLAPRLITAHPLEANS